jgi:type 1 glutamine amidotransferase
VPGSPGTPPYPPLPRKQDPMAAPKKVMVVVSGDDVDHDVISAAPFFQTLGLDAGFITRRAAGLQRFVDARPVTADTDIFVFYVAGGMFTADQQEEFERLIRSGKGLLAIHVSNVMGVAPDGSLDPAYAAYNRVLGNRYLSHGPGAHASRHTIEIIAEHPITAGVSDFEVFDEHYEFEFADDDHVVLAQRERSDGQQIPVLYTREVGEGRVVYLAMGHDLRVWGEPSFQQLVRQSIAWIARES